MDNQFTYKGKPVLFEDTLDTDEYPPTYGLYAFTDPKNQDRSQVGSITHEIIKRKKKKEKLHFASIEVDDHRSLKGLGKFLICYSIESLLAAKLIQPDTKVYLEAKCWYEPENIKRNWTTDMPVSTHPLVKYYEQYGFRIKQDSDAESLEPTMVTTVNTITSRCNSHPAMAPYPSPPGSPSSSPSRSPVRSPPRSPPKSPQPFTLPLPNQPNWNVFLNSPPRSPSPNPYLDRSDSPEPEWARSRSRSPPRFLNFGSGYKNKHLINLYTDLKKLLQNF